MSSSGMWRRVARVRTNVSELLVAYTIRVKRTSLLGDYFHPDDGGNTFLLNFGSHKSHTASQHRRRHPPFIRDVSKIRIPVAPTSLSIPKQCTYIHTGHVCDMCVLTIGRNIGHSKLHWWWMFREMVCPRGFNFRCHSSSSPRVTPGSRRSSKWVLIPTQSSERLQGT
jgi:hypothetical protein